MILSLSLVAAKDLKEAIRQACIVLLVTTLAKLSMGAFSSRRRRQQ